MQSISHYIRFGSHKEAKIFKHEALKEQNFGLTLNANVIAHTPASIYKMIYLSFPRINFFIDPQTYILQLDPLKYYSSEKIFDGEKVTKLKNSVQALLNEYGEPVKKIEKTMQQMVYADLKSGIAELTRNVVNFQENYLPDSYKSQKLDDGYDDYDDYDVTRIGPQYIIPPYFYLTLDDREWLSLNEAAAKEALKFNSADKIAVEIVMEKQILFSDSFSEEIIDTYNSLDTVKTIFIWIDSFDETAISDNYLTKWIEFLKKFKNKNIINLYGGHFSLILAKLNLLKGFCHGPGYGEHRGVKPVGGGIPTAKYYLPYISQRVDFELAKSVLEKKSVLNDHYFTEVCDCFICDQLLGPTPDEEKFFQFGNYKTSKSGKTQIPTEATLKNNQLHYLLRRFDDIKTAEVDDERKRFLDFVEWNKKNKIVSTQHLENWIKALHDSNKE